MTNRTLLTPDEVAKLLNVSTKTLANRRSAGKGPVYTNLDGSIRYPTDALEKYVNKKLHGNKGGIFNGE